MRILITCGDPNGIGLELLLRILADGALSPDTCRMLTLCIPPAIVQAYGEQLSRAGIVQPVQLDAASVTIGERSISLLPCTAPAYVPEFGVPTRESGMIARAALECAADALAQGEFQAVVTLPVSKEALAMAGFAYPGQTEFFGSVAERTPLMVLACQVLRVALVTIHVPLERVPSMITRERELQVIEQFHHMLSIDFGIESPRIAVLGLNPHAGERGLLGWQEEHIIGPAIRDAQRIGIAVSGPFAADGFFAHGAWQSYDGVIAQYHDQGLVPLKLLAQEQGVNITAGLPFVRTSPDHGTAYDLVGTGRARYASLLAAIWMAQYLATNRQVRTRHVSPS